MLPDISEIKLVRKRLGMTQAELSKVSDVSQSLIAKIEAGSITPSYGKARRIFEALEQAGKRHSLRARDIMSRKPKAVREQDSARKAISTMEKHGFSQLPVMKRDKCVGVVTESGALTALSGAGQKEFSSLRVSDIMEEPLPLVSELTLFPVLSGILSHEQALLVSKKGRLVGIITKSDLLKSALSGR